MATEGSGDVGAPPSPFAVDPARVCLRVFPKNPLGKAVRYALSSGRHWCCTSKTASIGWVPQPRDKPVKLFWRKTSLSSAPGPRLAQRGDLEPADHRPTVLFGFRRMADQRLASNPNMHLGKSASVGLKDPALQRAVTVAHQSSTRKRALLTTGPETMGFNVRLRFINSLSGTPPA